MTKSSKVESPTTWPFILYCMCCCCLPILVCCIFVIVILIKGGDLHKLKTMGNEFTRSTGLVEGSDADELCIKYDWKFYTGIVLFILQLVCCFYFAHVAADYVRQDGYPTGLWKFIPG